MSRVEGEWCVYGNGRGKKETVERETTVMDFQPEEASCGQGEKDYVRLLSSLVVTAKCLEARRQVPSFQCKL